MVCGNSALLLSPARHPHQALLSWYMVSPARSRHMSASHPRHCGMHRRCLQCQHKSSQVSHTARSSPIEAQRWHDNCMDCKSYCMQQRCGVGAWPAMSLQKACKCAIRLQACTYHSHTTTACPGYPEQLSSCWASPHTQGRLQSIRKIERGVRRANRCKHTAM